MRRESPVKHSSSLEVISRITWTGQSCLRMEQNLRRLILGFIAGCTSCAKPCKGAFTICTARSTCYAVALKTEGLVGITIYLHYSLFVSFLTCLSVFSVSSLCLSLYISFVSFSHLSLCRIVCCFPSSEIKSYSYFLFLPIQFFFVTLNKHRILPY